MQRECCMDALVPQERSGYLTVKKPNINDSCGAQ
jgi:hypothetical protein